MDIIPLKNEYGDRKPKISSYLTLTTQRQSRAATGGNTYILEGQVCVGTDTVHKTEMYPYLDIRVSLDVPI